MFKKNKKGWTGEFINTLKSMEKVDISKGKIMSLTTDSSKRCKKKKKRMKKMKKTKKMLLVNAIFVIICVVITSFVPEKVVVSCCLFVMIVFKSILFDFVVLIAINFFPKITLFLPHVCVVQTDRIFLTQICLEKKSIKYFFFFFFYFQKF